MKILSIGNSFSQDAHAYLHDLAAENGIDLYTCNLYIGGCSLETHGKHMANGDDAYEMEINGVSTQTHISIPAALAMEEWDVITLQQASHFSGRANTYFPWFGQLYDRVRQACPRANVYFHQTWAYPVASTHPSYPFYHNDQQMMFRCICSCADMVKRLWGLPVIPTGEVIQALRPILGEERIHRDHLHLGLEYGRLAAAATWLRTLTGCEIALKPYRNMDQKLTDAIFAHVNNL